MITAEPSSVTLSSDSSISLTPGAGSLATAADPPETLQAPAFTVEMLIDHSWRSMRMLGVCWDETLGKFVLHVAYKNEGGTAQLCECAMRILFASRVVLTLPTPSQPFVLPPDMEIRTACQLGM